MQSVVALGNFDGVHIGHAAVITRAKEKARALGCTPVLYSFSTHPQIFFGGTLPLLSTPREREDAIRALGVDAQIYDDFSLVAHLSAEEFVRKVLVERLHAAAVVTGPDYSFGVGKSGDVQKLKELGEQYGFEVITLSYTMINGEKVSSSALRTLVSDGQMDRTAKLLGRPYEMGGKVVSGKGLARTWGTPTVNVTLPKTKVYPRFGVYAAELAVGETVWQGVCNVGVRPSFDDGETPNIEVHVLDSKVAPEGEVTVRFLHFLRNEQRFSPDALVLQIRKDCEDAKRYFEERSAAK